MRQLTLRLRRLACMGVLAGWLVSATAAPAPTQPSEEDRGMAASLHQQLERVFLLPKDVRLDPTLRAAAGKIAADHLARMRVQLPAWVQEERSLQAGATGHAKPGELMHAVMARMYNEVAYWHIEPGDTDYEQATLEVLRTSPSVCRTGEDPYFFDFSSRILRIQAMPASRQQAALDSETRLLERWGKPRPPPLPWPATLPQDAAMAAVAQLLAGGPRPALALPPALSSRVLSARTQYAQLPREGRCAFQQWWLQNSLAQGQDAATALNAFRYGTLVTVTGRFGAAFANMEKEEADNADRKSPSYPKLAARFDVTGTTTLSRRFDAAGKPTQASVIARKITVRGIRGVRPIAFEDTFDALAVRHALENAEAAHSGGKPAAVFQMVWNLAPGIAASNNESPAQEPKR